MSSSFRPQIQRTPLRPGAGGIPNQQAVGPWVQQPQQLHQPRPQRLVQGRPIAPANIVDDFGGRRSHDSGGRTPGSDEIQILDEVGPPMIQIPNQAAPRQALARHPRQMNVHSAAGFFGQSSGMNPRIQPQQPMITGIHAAPPSRRVQSAAGE